MKVLLILGNQLVHPKRLPLPAGKTTLVFMREDVELCEHFRYHQQKIAFFLAAMRKYRDELKDHGYRVHYEGLDSSDGKPYEKSLSEFLKRHQATELHYFEIEDKFFESRLESSFQEWKLKCVRHASPLFLTSRKTFHEYVLSVKRPFMKTFYEQQRKRMRVLVTSKLEPVGGRWSYDDENRKALPAKYVAPELPKVQFDSIDREVFKLVQSRFPKHPGSVEESWLPTDRTQAELWLQDFLKNRLKDFGPYEDALSPDHPFVNHSILTPFLNCALLTPDQVVRETLKFATREKIPLNSLEGFIRQVIGWREFIRGIYQNFSEQQETTNFWNHQHRLNKTWYTASTGIPPLDDVIRKTLRYGYAHHIERLMVVGSLMLLLEVDPQDAHRWFMEMFVDSSDWVMGPNVYGMALFSDGGIFATKPYICGSNYYRKMGRYKPGPWQDEVDGAYWRFIDRHRDFFLRNPRLSMMVRSFDKMPADRKKRLLRAAETLQKRLTEKP